MVKLNQMEKRKARVFVVQESPTLDLFPAAKFGEMVVLLPAGDVFLSTAPTIATLREKLRDFSDQDFIVLGGDWVAMALAAQVASDVNGGRVQYLRWSKRERDYFPIKADIHLRPSSIHKDKKR